MHRVVITRLGHTSGLEKALNNRTTETGGLALEINFEIIFRDIARMEDEKSDLLHKIKEIVDSGETMREFSNEDFIYLHGIIWFLKDTTNLQKDAKILKENVTLAVRECVVIKGSSIYLVCPIQEEHPFHEKAFEALNFRSALMCPICDIYNSK